jgi:hypothetical protein
MTWHGAISSIGRKHAAWLGTARRNAILDQQRLRRVPSVKRHHYFCCCKPYVGSGLTLPWTGRLPCGKTWPGLPVIPADSLGFQYFRYGFGMGTGPVPPGAGRTDPVLTGIVNPRSDLFYCATSMESGWVKAESSRMFLTSQANPTMPPHHIPHGQIHGVAWFGPHAH